MEMKQTNIWMPTNFRSYLGSMETRQLIIPDPIYIEGLKSDKYAIKNNLEASKWANGYLPSVHSSFLSYQKAKKIKDVIRDKVLGGGIFLTGATNIIDEYSFYKFLAEEIDLFISRGSSIAKMDILLDGNIDITAIPLGYYDLTFGHKHKIMEAKIFLQNIDADASKYVLVEKRFYKKNDEYSYGRYAVERWSYDNNRKLKSTNEIEFKDLPQPIKEWCSLSNIDFKEHRLFKSSLGIYKFDNTWTNSAYPQSNVGESIYLVISDLLYALDHAFTSKENDKYIGRGRVIVPKAMQSSVGNIGSINTAINGIGQNIIGFGASRGTLDNTFYNEVPSNFNNDKAKLEAIQFSLRTQEWRLEIEGLLGDIASQCGITASMLDSRIVGSGAKTAYQICSEEDLTRATIEDKRNLINYALKPFFDDLKEYYHLTENISLKWSQAGLSNYSLLSSTTIQEYNAGLISLEVAVRKLHPDWNEEEIQKEIARLDNNAENIINQFNKVDNNENTDNDVEDE